MRGSVKLSYGVFKTADGNYVVIRDHRDYSPNHWNWVGYHVEWDGRTTWHENGYFYDDYNRHNFDLVEKIIRLPLEYLTMNFVRDVREIYNSVEGSDFFEPLLWAYVMEIRKQRNESLRNRSRTYHSQYDLL